MHNRQQPKSTDRKLCRRYDEPGHAHALTFSCYHRQTFLSRDRSRLWTLDAIRKANQKHKFHIWAYVLMPEHVHLLVYPVTPEYRISAYLASVKIPVARHAVAFVREKAPGFLHRMTDRQPSGRETLRFWQRGGGYDRNVWEAGYVWELINYIHANPVRSGLCQRPEEWAWSSARQYLGIEDEFLKINLETLPEDPRC